MGLGDRVYPRWRGEHEEPITAKEAATGLSPLARGTPFHRKFFALLNRFIPAGAGNTHHYVFYC
ncbi:hypothetical protein EBL_c30600 [Shimwellia blattae DSM 4481 = NBRC 105725]|uniref:Uncharacterized protein n=1 Tax=Shimwellia blattae (strain ATCC 29907 / DSM 4481 / JCM 1650 / NBRC 105725 / CDC 9005-74) TaxID=630626 RepID=I2BC76_SHIBC|nr:hypothetical protein EBL_c30600 [Shimwellia blattae DSM 4481 = NBRC 105725]